ncbi:hypothetical protein Nepgr_006301 [Nepenthes gracilis]|uniref:Reticulon-like protein n=1 Tax=Nepenthes gracilis TaxID=150966 RepID=A0AAD3S4R6_NEPGR|nr:hypothetical protein Nepgr_006301 [Nepenthes gracilis]
MENGRKKPTTRTTSSVAASPVRESGMKIDEVKGGFKVFNGDEIPQELAENTEPQPTPRLKRSQAVAVADPGKRKTRRPENPERSPVQTARERSELQNSSGDDGKELSGSLMKSPIQTKKKRSDAAAERTPMQITKTRSESQKSTGETVDGGETNSAQLRKSKSGSSRVTDETGRNFHGSNERNLVQMRNMKSDIDRSERNSAQSSKLKMDFDRVNDNSGLEIDGSDDEAEKSLMEVEKVSTASSRVPEFRSVCSNGSPFEVEESRSEEFDGVSQGKDMTDGDPVDSPERSQSGEDKADAVDGYEDEFVDDDGHDEEEEVDQEIEVEDVKEMTHVEDTCKKELNDVKKFNQITAKSSSIPSIVGKQLPPFKNQTTNTQNFSKPAPNPFSEECQRIPETHNKLQTLVDLVMWRDVSRSAFVFGMGTFMIISSSYAKDLNISLISVISYLGLVYLAIIFLYRSFLCRGIMDVEDSSHYYGFGEEEAIWLLRLILPYLNEFLLKIRCLFSGDPAMTMKLAAVLFVLARCGSSITLWKMVKLGFFGVFTVPKACSCYSAQIASYGKFWIRRFRDAWESCSHKKAVAFALFTLVWNLSSVAARIWAAFMLFVALRYYQQNSTAVNDSAEYETDDLTRQTQPERRKRILSQRRCHTFADREKEKKGF